MTCDTAYCPGEREGRSATALLLAECQKWPPAGDELPTTERIRMKIEELWLQDDEWHRNFSNMLAVACLKNPERAASLLRYLHPAR